jgi:hypothetical protein
MFRKPPWKNDLNHDSSSLLIRWLKSNTGNSLQPFTQNQNTQSRWIDSSNNNGRITPWRWWWTRKWIETWSLLTLTEKLNETYQRKKIWTVEVGCSTDNWYGRAACGTELLTRTGDWDFSTAPGAWTGRAKKRKTEKTHGWSEICRRLTGPPIVRWAGAKAVSKTDGAHGMNRQATQRTNRKCRAKNDEKTILAKESNNNRSDLVEKPGDKPQHRKWSKTKSFHWKPHKILTTTEVTALPPSLD